MPDKITEREYPVQRAWAMRFLQIIWAGYIFTILFFLTFRSHFGGHAAAALVMFTLLAVGLSVAFLVPEAGIHYSFDADGFVFYRTIARWRGKPLRLPYSDLVDAYVFQTNADKRDHLASLVLKNNTRLSLNTYDWPGMSDDPRLRRVAGTGPWNSLFVIDGLREEDAQRLSTIVRERMQVADSTPAAPA